jgi:hypothetical protein
LGLEKQNEQETNYAEFVLFEFKRFDVTFKERAAEAQSHFKGFIYASV